MTSRAEIPLLVEQRASGSARRAGGRLYRVAPSGERAQVGDVLSDCFEPVTTLSFPLKPCRTVDVETFSTPVPLDPGRYVFVVRYRSETWPSDAYAETSIAFIVDEAKQQAK